MTALSLRFVLLVGALCAFRTSFLVEPLYRARPAFLLEPVSVVLPPYALSIAVQTALMLGLIWVAESYFCSRALKLEWSQALQDSLRTYLPLALLWSYILLLVPGLAVVPATGWWVLLDARYWLLTLAAGMVVFQKATYWVEHKPDLPRKIERLLRSRAVTVLLGLLFLALLVALTPKRRFTQPYDERWGTGDEPRYVRIASSLLHDGDADIGNASELIGKRAEPLRLGWNLLAWIPSAFRVLGEVPQSLFGSGLKGEAHSLGGQVIQGRGGGTYYVYLPGFPLLLVPAMALDSFLHADQLPIMLFTCLLLGGATVMVVARLVEPFLESRAASYGLAFALGLTIPLFLHHFQVYPEVTAALSVAVMLLVLLDPHVDWRGTFAFSTAAALMPWLHPKYYPIWGICICFFAWKVWHEDKRWKSLTTGVGIPFLSMGLLCLYVFHISGSLMPDTLWVLNGYPRGASLANRTTPAGLYHLFLGSWQGLLVYGPLYALALPGWFMLRKRSRFAFGLVLTVSVPYLLIAASHDLGGARGWIPASRYMVVLVPVLGLGLAGWLSGSGGKKFRWFALFVGASASFWIAQGMLEEPNFVYDRPAFLASRHVNVSPALGTVLDPQPVVRRVSYPAFLLLALVLFWWGERWRSLATPMKKTVGLLGVIVIGGALASIWSDPEEWIARREGKGPVQLRPGRSSYLVATKCETGRSRLGFEGSGGAHRVSVRGLGLERHIHVPSMGRTELDLDVHPIVVFSGGGPRKVSWIELHLEAGQDPLVVKNLCP